MLYFEHGVARLSVQTSHDGPDNCKCCSKIILIKAETKLKVLCTLHLRVQVTDNKFYWIRPSGLVGDGMSDGWIDEGNHNIPVHYILKGTKVDISKI